MKNIDYLIDAGSKIFVQSENIKEIYYFKESEIFVTTVFRFSCDKNVIKRKYQKFKMLLFRFIFF